MIEKIYKNKYMVTCDNCGTGQEFDTWTDALEYMFEEGWKKKLVDGEWEHYCPECQESEERESMKGLQSVYNQIINILKENNVLINITSPRPYLIKKDDEERINAEADDLFKKCKIEEYNSKMKEKEAYKLYFDEAYKYTNFYEEGDE